MVGNTQDFATMLGGASTNVDYSESAVPDRGYLPMPEATDNLETTVRKMEALAAVVSSGRSLAVATGFQKAAHAERDPEKLARMSMTPKEVAQFEAWKAGVTMPPFDWVSNVKPVQGGAQSQIRMGHRAKAMDRIWAHEGATAQNASWLASNMAYAIPLVVAVTKVQVAERELRGGQSELADLELAEVQTIHKAVAVAMDNMNNIYQQLNNLSRSINQSKEVLQAYEHHIRLRHRSGASGDSTRRLH